MPHLARARSCSRPALPLGLAGCLALACTGDAMTSATTTAGSSSSSSSSSTDTAVETTSSTGTTSESTSTSSESAGTSTDTSSSTTEPATTGTTTTGDLPGEPVVLVDNCVRCRQLVLDEDHVYFTALGLTNADNGVLGKVAKTGGAVTTLADGLVSPFDLALRDGILYWVDGKRGVVEKVSIDGDAYALVAEGLILPVDVDTDADHVYWVDAGDSMMLNGSLARAPLAGGPPETLLDGLDSPQTIAVVGESVVWVEAGAVRAMPKNGGAVEVLAKDQPLPASLLAEGNQVVYWVNKGMGGTGSIQRVDLMGGAFEPLVSGLTVPWDLALDGERVYWTNVEAGKSILYAPRDGGDPQIALGDQGRPEGIAVDDTHIFWADFGLPPSFSGGQLVRLLKP
ncbi:MAG: hypothetical protein R3B09_00270 [Nannocystaceae bacterium]